jgi:hypothetical protein
MDRAALFDDLASPSLCLSEVAARHGLTLDALSIYLASDEAQATLDHIQSTLAIRTRLAAQIRLPIAIAALGTLLTSHRAVAFPSPTAQLAPPSDNVQQSGPVAAPASDQPVPQSTASPTPRDEARSLRHQIELRRAASTLLRFSNFNHRALARAHTSDPRQPIAPREPSRATEPQHFDAPEPARATTPREPSRESESRHTAPEPPRAPTATEAPSASLPHEPPLTSTHPDPAPHTRARIADAQPAPASSRITSTSPASPSLYPLSISSIPLPIPPPFHSHPDPSSSSSCLFLRASPPPWFIPASSAAAKRLAAAAGAGASTHPP